MGETTVQWSAAVLPAAATAVSRSLVHSCYETLLVLSDFASDSSAQLPATIPIHITSTLTNI